MQRGGRVKDVTEYPSEVLDFAVYLGMDPNVDVQHLWMAEECLGSALPAPWTEHTSSRGDVYFYNADTDASMVEHPLEAQYRQMYTEAKMGAGGRVGSAQDDFDPDEAVPISHQEISDMCSYYDVDAVSEAGLLPLMREAVLTPLPWMYREVTDMRGHPYFYNSETDESHREHPLDVYWQDLVQEARNSQDVSRGEPWMVFFSAGGIVSYYSFEHQDETSIPPEGMDEEGLRLQIASDHHHRRQQVLGERDAQRGVVEEAEAVDPYEGIDDEVVQEMSQLLGMRPSDPRVVKFVREMEDRKRAIERGGKTWTTEKYDDGRKVDISAPKMRPRQPPPTPKRLVFFAWWFEEGVKKYMELRYDMGEKIFHITLNKTVALRDVKIAGREGELLQCWDLYIGQKIDVLGKPTTLMQADHNSLQWLEYHAKRLLKKAHELENEIMQFKPIPDVIHRILSEKNLSDGRVSLRWVMKHISMLTTQLYRIKPSTSK